MRRRTEIGQLIENCSPFLKKKGRTVDKQKLHVVLIKTYNYRKASEKRRKNVVQYANEWKSTDVFGNEKSADNISKSS